MPAPLFNWLHQRHSGCLAHISALPSNYGIGNLGRGARAFVDLLADCSISQWQICPLGPTGFGDSPYSAFSAFAGNPYFIDWSELIDNNLLSKHELLPLTLLPHDYVSYGDLYHQFWPIAYRVAQRWVKDPFDLDEDYTYSRFQKEESDWLEDFALFRGLKSAFNGIDWTQWPRKYRIYASAKKQKLPKGVTVADIEAEKFLQYIFFHQWRKLKVYAKEVGVQIVGDLPIFISKDSAEAWARPDLFITDAKTGCPSVMAGVPPDYFSELGQLWGNPLYDWATHASDGYAWWLRRFDSAFNFFDIVRLDHFRGFEAYWEVPAGAKDARAGTWKPGPGIELFQALRKRKPDARIIAEDLGTITDEVNALREDSGIPGMAILQFGFGGSSDNWYLPHNHEANQAVYTGSHDNNTSLGWYREVDDTTRDHLRRYFRVSGETPGWDLIRAAYASPCRISFVMLQDFLSLGTEARFNLPGSSQGNWKWRATARQLEGFYHNSHHYVRGLSELYGRH
ncbi:MAG: 4-alpha-glucanotransferase [Opitutales bacterium]|nr:4-alpha-glucanotransferase [Opitutales bacterium]